MFFDQLSNDECDPVADRGDGAPSSLHGARTSLSGSLAWTAPDFCLFIEHYFFLLFAYVAACADHTGCGPLLRIEAKSLR